MKKHIKVELIADVICPWCYIGKTRLEKAMQEKKELYSFEYTLLPFQLYPNLPEGGSLLSDFKHKRRPGAGRALMAEAKASEIEIDYKKISRMPNSREALKLLYLCKGNEKQALLIQNIYIAYFQEGLDISDRELLMDLALEVRLDSAILSAFNDPDWDDSNFIHKMDHFRKEGIINVPTIIFNDQFPVIGVQPLQNWYRYFDRLSPIA